MEHKVVSGVNISQQQRPKSMGTLVLISTPGFPQQKKKKKEKEKTNNKKQKKEKGRRIMVLEF